MTNLVLSVPTYGPVEPEASRHLRVAMMHAANSGLVRWVGDVSPNKVKWDAARNVSVKLALESTNDEVSAADAILWVDSDVVLPAGAITRLVAEQKDFITGIYTQREPPHFPLVANFDRDRKTFSWFVDFPDNVVAPIDGCGFGVVLTSTKMLRAMGAPWFTFEQYSEDFDFCLRAAKAGFQLFVHTGVQCGHLRDPRAYGLADFRAIRDAGGLRAYLERPVPESAA